MPGLPTAPPPAASLWDLTGPDIPADSDLPTRADVVIVGGGLTGLALAVELSEAGGDVVVVEARELGGVTTSRTTGKASLLQGTVASRLRRHGGDRAVADYLAANRAGAAWLERRLIGVPDARIERPAVTYATTAEGRRALDAEAEAWEAVGEPVERLGAHASVGLPFAVSGALRRGGQAQLHPRIVTAALAEQARGRGAVLIAHCRMTDARATARGVRVQTDRGRILADHLVLATGAPVLDRSLLFAAVTPHRQPVVAFRMPWAAVAESEALEALEASEAAVPPRAANGATAVPPLEAIYLSVDPQSRSLRGALDRDGAPVLVVGGGDVVTGRADVLGARRDELIAWTAEHFPDATPLCWWAAQDYLPVSGAPFVGEIAGGRGRIWAVTGFAKWGMTNAAASALALSARLGGRAADGEELGIRVGAGDARAGVSHGGRHRSSLTDVGSAFSANLEVGKELVGGWVSALRAPEAGAADGASTPGRTNAGDGSSASGQPTATGARIVRHGRRPVAESTVDGRHCRVSAVCTHLGGIVRWNSAEQTWDCPLHGSRFTPAGRVLEGPARRDLPRREGDHADRISRLA